MESTSKNRLKKHTSFSITTSTDLSEFVKSHRKKNSISQEELATFANISRLAVSEFETGKSDIKLSTLIKIINACSLELEIRER